MKELSIISFTENGIRLSRQIALKFEEKKCMLYTKCSAYAKRDEEDIKIVEKSIDRWAKEHMEQRHALLFIGACGIAVRAIAPALSDKLWDSPVLVMDELGRYVIPILSGHMGGANELALQIAGIVHADPVITTATDINKAFAADIFAKKQGLFLVNKEGIAKVSAKALRGETITISVEDGHVKEDGGRPKGIRLTAYPPKEQTDILITSETEIRNASLLLRPKEYVVGIGCRKEKEAEKIKAFLDETLKGLGIETGQVAALASIDLKAKEKGLLAFAREKDVPFVTYTAEELWAVEGDFQTSDFVKKQTGVDNVCERAALKACGQGGSLVLGKCAKDGMTVAVARKKWSVQFDEI